MKLTILKYCRLGKRSLNIGTSTSILSISLLFIHRVLREGNKGRVAIMSFVIPFFFLGGEKDFQDI